MLTGNYFFNHTDLKLGNTGTPLGLALTRSYNSGVNYTKAMLGYGWTHGYDIKVDVRSDGLVGLGDNFSLAAAAAVVEAYVTTNILTDNEAIERVLVATLSHKWLMDNLTDNIASVKVSGYTNQFIKLPDGSYLSPPGSTTTLSKDSTFRIEERFGTEIYFDSMNRISSWQDIDGNTAEFYYSGDLLSSVEDSFGRSLSFLYSNGLLESVSDSSGRTVSYGYDTNDNLTSYTDAEGEIWQYGYDSDHRMTSLTNPLGTTTASNTYDSRGKVVTQSVPRKVNGVNDYRIYKFYFSDFRNVEEDPEGNQTIYLYDKRGRKICQQDALGNIATFIYDGKDHIVEEKDSRGSITQYEYDNNNNLTKITDADGGETTNTYDSSYRLIELTDPLGYSIEYDYDEEHHLISTKTYPEDGKEIQHRSIYYENGLVHKNIDGRGITTVMAYDTKGNPLSVTVKDSPPVNYVYDAIGQLRSLTDQANSLTQFAYDDRGLLESKTDPNGNVSSYTYYDNGKLWTATDRNSDTTTYTYTLSGKVDTITFQDSTSVSFNYDSRENVVEMIDSIGTTEYNSYDENNRLEAFTNPHDYTISYTYDENGNITSITYPGNKTVFYTYDNLNRLDTVTIGWLVSNNTATYHYDAGSRLTDIDQFNNSTVSFGYDEANRFLGLRNKKSDDTTINYYVYRLDGNGNRIHIDKEEPLNTTPSLQSTGYTYSTYGNKLMSAGADSFDYDDEGQLSTKNSVQSYLFDDQHRLKTIVGTAEFSYDGQGNRLQAVRGSVTTRYIYDAAGNLIAEAVKDGETYQITRYYIYGAGLLAMVTANGDLYCYHFNGIGSTIAMTDSGQNIVKSYAYSPFGIILSESGTIDQPFRFVGEHGVMTEPDGLYYMRARYYDPNVGRFISEDPIGFDGGDVNLYAYVGNNPISIIDPLGLKPGDQFATVDEAAKDALGYIFLKSYDTDWEYSGWIYQNENDSYSYISARTQRNCHIVYPGPQPNNTVASYHTHGRATPNYTGEFFSGADFDFTNYYMVDSYLATPTSRVLKMHWLSLFGNYVEQIGKGF